MTITAEDAPTYAAPARTGPDTAPGASLALAFRFALRELRRGLSGFLIFIGCIALGVAAIAGVNAVALAITDGVLEEGETILGGDLDFQSVNRVLPDAELTFVRNLGRTSEIADLRAMARNADNSAQMLVEVKAVDAVYPLIGELVTEPPVAVTDLIENGGAAVDRILLSRLNIGVGDTIRVGTLDLPVRAIIETEPDRVSDGFLFGPRVLIGRPQLDAAGLVRPGSLINWKTRVDLDGASTADLAAIEERAKATFPEASWRIRSRANAAPGLTRSIERFSQFLTLVGLTALVVGGVGVANATRAYLDTKRSVIASFKAQGAPANFVFSTYLIQMLIIATIGIVIGLVLGSIMPVVAEWALQDVLPVAQGSAFQPWALASGIAYGYLTALAFALWPLGQARDVPATALFRSAGRAAGGRPRLIFVIAMAAVLLALCGLAVWQAADKRVALTFIGGIAFAFVLLRGVSMLIQWAAKRFPRVSSTPLRMAIGNIHRPGALTPSVVLSLGLGLALLVALALIDANLRNQISNNIPDDAPDFFFVDIQDADIAPFREFVAADYPDATLQTTPMLRGRVTKLKGIDAAKADVAEGGRWVLRGDRGITYAVDKPANATLESGEWWPADYSGEPLVSVAAEEAGEIGVAVGDTITVNVLGRDITARVASTRNVEWESFGMNFVMVFSPNTFAGAPHAHLATLALAGETRLTGPETKAETDRDAAVLREVTDRFPTVTAVRVRDALTAVNGLVGQLATAIRAAAAVALVASILVLAGALAAGNSARTHDAVVLKTLGATRRTLIGAYVSEYSILGLATALFALLAGGIAAWFVIAGIMGFSFAFSWPIALATITAALVFTVGFGLVGTWRVLGQKAAPVLREL